ncbi:HAD-IIB family hydrolase [Planococcus glaciei]|uniref:HAD-IIB family hydrolase n=1 Tax=Planococcus glaciei TaxID=459472 RepID=UPI001F39A93F|nr:HAD-IIB family hydrolase [Planococcus glaciei]
MQKTKHILATDLDGTLVGDPDGLQQLLEFYEEQVYDVSLIYITGRYFDSALSLIKEENLPVPDILVTDVGSSIYIGNSFDKDLEWQKRIKANWMPDEIHAIAATVPGLTKQPMFLENRCSYYVADEKPVEEFRNKLASSGIPHKLIFSGGKDVDIVPEESGKGRALQYLLDKYKVEDAKLLVAGDSGNDLEMLTLGFPSVIVGNAQPELLESDEHPRIFRAKKGFAGGIHEAWTHFHSD